MVHRARKDPSHAARLLPSELHVLTLGKCREKLNTHLNVQGTISPADDVGGKQDSFPRTFGHNVGTRSTELREMQDF